MAIVGDLWAQAQKNWKEFLKLFQTKEGLRRFRISLGGREMQLCKLVDLCPRDSDTKIEFAIEIEILSLYRKSFFSFSLLTTTMVRY